MQYPIKRTPEEGHTPACWVKAITCALENERDALRDVNKGDDEAGSHDFRLWLQDNGPLQWAEEYLANGDTECLCEPIKTRTINTTLGKVRFYN